MKIDPNNNLCLEPHSESYDHTPPQYSKTLPFHITAVGHFYAEDNYCTDRESFDNYLLIYSLSGKGYVKSAGCEHIILPGQAVLIYCGTPHVYKTYGSDGWEFKWVHFSGNSATAYYDILNKDGVAPVNLQMNSEIGDYFDDIAEILEFGINIPDIKACARLSTLISEIIVRKNSTLNNPMFAEHKGQILHAVHFIEENYAKDITISDIAQVSYLSKSYFLKVFRELTGAPPYEYLINYRTRKAQYLLSHSDMGIGEIALAVGFSDASGFIRSFRKTTGYTPLKFKKAHIE